MINDLSFGENAKTPDSGEAAAQPLLLPKHANPLLNYCKIDPEVLTEARARSLQGDNGSRRFLSGRDFDVANTLIQNGVYFPVFNPKREDQGGVVLSGHLRRDYDGLTVFFEKRRRHKLTVGIHPRVVEWLEHGNFDGAFLWADNIIDVLIGISHGMAGLHVVQDECDEKLCFRGHLHRVLHELQEHWHAADCCNPHIFLRHSQPLKPSGEAAVDALSVIARAMRDQGYEVTEINLASSGNRPQWVKYGEFLRPEHRWIQRVHQLLSGFPQE